MWEETTRRADFCPVFLWPGVLEPPSVPRPQFPKFRESLDRVDRVQFGTSEQFPGSTADLFQPTNYCGGQIKITLAGVSYSRALLCAFVFLGHSDKTTSLSELFYCLSLGVQA